MNQSTQRSFPAAAWLKLPLVIRSIITGFLVSSAGIAAWSVCLLLVPAPWSILPMTGGLCAFYQYFSGKWKVGASGRFRQNAFRSTSLTRATWKWGIAAALLFVVVVQASFVVTFRLIDFPHAAFTADYKAFDHMRPAVAWLMLIMSSVVAGICEEAGFRGFLQAPLEKKYGAATAIVITSIIFMAIHLSHTWARPIAPHIFFASVLLGILAWRTRSLLPGIIGHSILDVFDYSVWWTDLTGLFHQQTIFRTGMDLHFIVWTLILLLGLFGFSRVMIRLQRSGDAHPDAPGRWVMAV